ncbi:MAG TPA: S53 family peptidase [Candidatus Paceibacterota bacterium]|nr:S53 family peptidase [Candidatus Paceibacterota bacterium]
MHHISREIDSIKRFLIPLFLLASLSPGTANAATMSASGLKNLKIDSFVARLPLRVLGSEAAEPTGLSPDRIKAAYHLPKSGGNGTIAIVTAFDGKTIESDLAGFNQKFGLPECTTQNGCLTIHSMTKNLKTSSGWALETALDTEWAHAIAPDAKILVVEAASDSGPNLLKAVDYARAQPGVVAVSMSWGGDEFKDETKSDSHFSGPGISFFAASGDDGYGASWPASSPSVISVGGTSLTFKSDGSLDSEKAWSGSGGGVSAYEKEPGFQVSYSIAKAKGKRAIPDVSFDADPHSGYSVYHLAASNTGSHARTATSTLPGKGWYVVGGTSAGAPQWAAIRALLGSATSTVPLITRLYEDKASANHSNYFRDIVSGSNGACTYYCDARKHYDYVTGLGSPLTYRF